MSSDPPRAISTRFVFVVSFVAWLILATLLISRMQAAGRLESIGFWYTILCGACIALPMAAIVTFALRMALRSRTKT
jgi:hypothetical protein